MTIHVRRMDFLYDRIQLRIICLLHSWAIHLWCARSTSLLLLMRRVKQVTWETTLQINCTAQCTIHTVWRSSTFLLSDAHIHRSFLVLINRLWYTNVNMWSSKSLPVKQKNKTTLHRIQAALDIIKVTNCFLKTRDDEGTAVTPKITDENLQSLAVISSKSFIFHNTVAKFQIYIRSGYGTVKTAP